MPFIEIRNRIDLPCLCVLPFTVCSLLGLLYFEAVLGRFKFRVVLTYDKKTKTRLLNGFGMAQELDEVQYIKQA